MDALMIAIEILLLSGVGILICALLGAGFNMAREGHWFLGSITLGLALILCAGWAGLFIGLEALRHQLEG